MIERAYRISDVVNDEFLRFPLTLLANPKYKEMSLEAKFIYSLLLNRLTLSQKNGWINEDKEVYLIYTREEASDMLNISYKKTIAAFRELIDKGLLYEKRQGRGYPNLLYVLKAELNDTDASNFAQKYDETSDESTAEAPSSPHNTQTCQNDRSRHSDSAHQDLSKSQFKICQNDTLRTAVSEDPELPKVHPIKNNNKYIEMSYLDNSLSIRPVCSKGKESDGQADKDNKLLESIFERCELELFQPNIRAMIRNAVERLYYSETLKIGNARLPQEKVRSYLKLLDAEAVISSLERMKQNSEPIVNPTAYLMSTLFNSICEKDSSLILSVPPEYLDSNDIYLPAKTGEKEVIRDAPE